MINVTKEELFDLYMELRERLDLIEGRPRGPISITEARLANERGDKATVKRFHLQESARLKGNSKVPVHAPRTKEQRPWSSSPG